MPEKRLPRPQKKPVPLTLVEKENAAAIKLQMPSTKKADTFIVMGLGQDSERYDTPIGRTLTEEFIRRDPHRCPSVAIGFLPVNDAAREKLARAAEQACEAPKGRPTPKRPRRSHVSQ